MVAYESIKSFLKQFTSVNVGIRDFIAGSGGRFIASTICYPLVLVRSRLQQKRYRLKDLSNPVSIENKEVLYNTLRSGFRITYNREGLKGFYKGYLTTTIKSTVQQGVFFVGFEAAMRFLNKLT